MIPFGLPTEDPTMLLTRRFFLRLCGTAAVALTAAPALRFARGQDTVRKGKTLVLIFLRGGQDGLNLLVPYGDADYAKLRPRLAMRPPREGDPGACLDLDGFFGLHPQAGALRDLFNKGQAAFLPAVGNPSNNRSHFAQQDTWETAKIGDDSVLTDGWLNRYLQTSEGHGPLRAVAIGNALPRILRGDAPAVAIRNVADLAYNNRFGDNAGIAGRLRDLYRGEGEGDAGGMEGSGDADGENEMESAERSRDTVESAGRTTLDSLKALETIARETYQPADGANYPDNNGVATQLRSVAHLIKSDVGLEVVEIDYGGWDTHQNQGDNATGAYATKVAVVSEALAAFARDLGDRLEDVVVMTITEFGRTASENGTAGTDHGHAGAVTIVGGLPQGVGGRVHGEWPGLAKEKLNRERDLAITTDFRDLFAEALANHLGHTQMDVVLPDHERTPLNLLKKPDESEPR